MTQLANYLSYKYKDLSLTPKAHVKSPGIVDVIFIPGLGGRGRQVPGAYSPACLTYFVISRALGQRDTLQGNKKKLMVPKNDTQDSLPTSICVYACVHTCTCAWESTTKNEIFCYNRRVIGMRGIYKMEWNPEMFHFIWIMHVKLWFLNKSLLSMWSGGDTSNCWWRSLSGFSPAKIVSFYRLGFWEEKCLKVYLKAFQTTQLRSGKLFSNS